MEVEEQATAAVLAEQERDLREALQGYSSSLTRNAPSVLRGCNTYAQTCAAALYVHGLHRLCATFLCDLARAGF